MLVYIYNYTFSKLITTEKNFQPKKFIRNVPQSGIAEGRPENRDGVNPDKPSTILVVAFAGIILILIYLFSLP
jgi:hypothetical protein